ncbi:MAG: hypothetical protein Q4F41_07725, partial [Eubacteriales bacterium]|nr:hypothetical protein [Eubacteriales bacterium]
NTSSTNNTNSTGSDSALGTKDAPAVNSQNDGTTSSNSSTGSSSASGTVSTDPALTGDMTDIWPAVIAALSALLVIGATILTGRKERVEKNEQK